MYFIRIRFNTIDDMYIDYEEETRTLFELDGKSCILGSCQGQIKSANRLYISYGAFDEEEVAREIGHALLCKLKWYCIQRSISIKISGESGETDSVASLTSLGGFTEHGRKTSGVPDTVKNDYLGLAIFEVKQSLDELEFFSSSMSPSLRFGNFNIDTNFNKKYNQRVQISISLLNSSNILSNDVRISFLLTIMSIEALVSETVKREDEIVALIEKLSMQIENPTIKSQIKNLKNKSIGVKCREIVSRFCFEEEYNGQSAVKFWDKCYQLRSSFVHNGTLSAAQITTVSPALKKLVFKVINYYIEETL